MNNERTAMITIGGDEYALVLTTRATKQIAGRYGGLENLGDKLLKSENFEMAIGEIVWLITLLANQSLLIHNLKHMFEDISRQLKNKAIQETVLEIRAKYGKNAILKGMNYEEAATGRERNNQIGGHKSGTGESAHASIPKGEAV